MTETRTDSLTGRVGDAQTSTAIESKQVLRPYGDTTGDGMIQVSFTLPVPAGRRAEAAAVRLAEMMGLESVSVVHSKAMGPDFTFFIVYGRALHLIDYTTIPEPPGREYPLLSAGEVNLAIRTVLGRRLVIVGACIGTDAHTVGIDAILNVKGFAGEKGLEYYREIQVVNMGAQVTVEELVARAKEENADAVLVSQVVTQKNAHIHNTKQMAAAFHSFFVGGSGGSSPRAGTAGIGRPLLVVGGPRFDTVTGRELGVDRIFGRGTTPGEVASYLAHTLAGENS